MKKIDFGKTANEIIEALGGQENIKDIFHCATRLRFYLKDDQMLNQDLLKPIEFVKGYNKQDEQHQIIVGSGTVDKVFKAVENQLKGTKVGEFDAKNKVPLWRKELNWKSNSLLLTKRGLNSFASIFVPLIPVFIAGGLTLALQSLIKQINPNTGFTKLFDIIGGAILSALPAFVGYTAAKRWGGNAFLGMAIGLILVAPGVLNRYLTNTPVQLGFDFTTNPATINAAVQEHFLDYLNKLGISLEEATRLGITPEKIVGTYSTIFSGFFQIKLIGYQAQIIPTLLVIGISVNLERLLRRYIPDVVGIILVPLVTVLVAAWLAFWAIGPLGEIIGKGISSGLEATFTYTNWYGIGFGGSIFSGLYPLLVVTGLHQGFLPIETQLIVDSTLKYQHAFTFITPVACVSNIAQGTACFMLFFFIKNKKEKSKAISGAFGGYTGITEPAMFGVNLQIKPLFVAAIIGSAVGGWWLGMTHTVANSLGSASWIGLVQFDWTTNYTQNFFNETNVHAILTNVPMGGHVTIAMVISLLTTAGAVFGLMKTKWGKNSMTNYLTQINK